MAALVLLLVLPGSAAAAAGCVAPIQPGWMAGVEAGGARYDVAGGLEGVEWGPDVGYAGRDVVARVGYRRLEPTSGLATPQLVRGAIEVEMATVRGVRVCGVVHGGGSWFNADADHASVLAGGVGLGASGRVPAGPAGIHPFVEARGLAATSSGEVLGLAVDRNGYSAGIEAGMVVVLGLTRFRLAGVLDGFAPGLGVTPYPNRAVRMGLTLVF